MQTTIGAIFWSFVLTGAISAAEVRSCQEVEFTSAEFLAEPWEENTRVFADGTVRLAVLDMLEPAASAFHLLVLSPPLDIVGQPQCQVISHSNGQGYGEMSLVDMRATYDPTRGLIFEVPITVGVEIDQSGHIMIELNQSTGALTAKDSDA